MFVCPSYILYGLIFIFHAVDLMVLHHHHHLCHDWFILMTWCSVIGCLADLRTTAGP